MRKIKTRYGHLSRGRCWGRWYAGKSDPVGDFAWCDKHNGTLYVPDGPGLLVYGSHDGFRRKERESHYFSSTDEETR